MKDGKNRISFNKVVKMTDGKTDTIYSTLINKIEKCGGVESLNGCENLGVGVIIGLKKVAAKLKKDDPKIIFIHCHNCR